MEENFKDKKLDCLIVDPPRTGLDEKMLASIIKSEVKKIIYVSCNPSTLAKNINDLKDYYKVSSIKAIDIFSQTEHVETIALLFKLKTDKHIDCDECWKYQSKMLYWLWSHFKIFAIPINIIFKKKPTSFLK